MNLDWDFLPVIEKIYSEIGWQKDGYSVANKSDLIQRLNFSVSIFSSNSYLSLNPYLSFLDKKSKVFFSQNLDLLSVLIFSRNVSISIPEIRFFEFLVDFRSEITLEFRVPNSAKFA